MDSRRIILINGSRFLRDMVKRSLMKSPGMEVVAEVANLAELSTAIKNTDAQWVIYFLQPGGDVPEILEKLIVQDFPNVHILGISMDGSRVKLEWIGLREKYLEDSSLEQLTTLLRNSYMPKEVDEKKTGGVTMLNETDQLSLRKTLEKSRATLLQEIRRDTEKLNSYTMFNPDPVDLAEKSTFQGSVSSRIDRMTRRLKQVETALKRLDEGVYGVCSKCGGQINIERLKVIPYTTLCVKCKSKLEQRRA